MAGRLLTCTKVPVLQHHLSSGLTTRLCQSEPIQLSLVQELPGDQYERNRPHIDSKIAATAQQRLAEVEDFVEFLAARESRAVAGASLGESFAKLDKLNLAQLTDEEIDAEIQAARKERAVQR